MPPNGEHGATAGVTVETTKLVGTSSGNNGKLWLQAVLLCLVNLLNYMDRYTVSGVLESITEDFGMTHDWQGGLLQTAFVICYFASAPIFGFLGDRYSRKYLMMFGILTWAACSFAASFMKDYVSFLVVRAAIGFGESGFVTIAPTLLADMFSDKKLTLVLAIFYFSIPLGSGLGFMVGSAIATATGDWRWGVRFTPILTFVVLILLFFFLQDHPRGAHAKYEVDMTGMSKWDKVKSYCDDLAYLIKNKTYLLTTFGACALNFATGALAWWGPHIVEDALTWRIDDGINTDNDPPVESASFLFGLILAVAGVLGLTFGSGLSFLLRPKIRRVDPLLCGVSLLISSPLILTAIIYCKVALFSSIALLSLGELFLNMNWAIAVDISMYVVVPTRRNTAEAFQLMMSHALGEAGAPYLIGLITDAIRESYSGAMSTSDPSKPMGDAEKSFLSLGHSFYVTIAMEFLAAFFFLCATWPLIKDWDKAEREEQDLAKLKPDSNNELQLSRMCSAENQTNKTVTIQSQNNL